MPERPLAYQNVRSGDVSRSAPAARSRAASQPIRRNRSPSSTIGKARRPRFSASRLLRRRSAVRSFAAKNDSGIAGCMSAVCACTDFLHTSGKCPASLTIPPFWPPMPRAQVLHVFLLRRRCNVCVNSPVPQALPST